MKNIIKMYGTKICDDCIRTKKLFADYNVAYEFIDIAEDEKGLDEALELSDGQHITPVVLMPDGKVLLEPTNKEMIALLGLK